MLFTIFIDLYFAETNIQITMFVIITDSHF